MDKIKMVQYGCGKMSKYTISYALEKGVELVGAFDIDKNKIGKDVSIVTGGNDLGVKYKMLGNLTNFYKKMKLILQL